MPYPNEHAARLRDPDSLTPLVRVRRTSGSGDGRVDGVEVPDSIDVIWYIIRRDGQEVPVAQALRFPKSRWTAAEARKWLSNHDIDPILFEPAGTAAAKPGQGQGVGKERQRDGGRDECVCPDCGHKQAHDRGTPCVDQICDECGAHMAPVAASLTIMAPDTAWGPAGEPEQSESDDHSVIRQRFTKELFRAGHYQQGDGTEYDITSADIDEMASETQRMIDNGVRIPLSDGPVPHEDVDNPDNSIGKLARVFSDGQSLWGEIEIVGQDAIENAMQNDVSIYSPAQFVDGKGTKYVQPITHVAVTPNPLVPGLADWQKIAASLKGESKQGKSKTGGSMWKKLAKALGMSDEDIKDLTDENGLDKILAGIKSMKEAHKDALKEAKKAAVKAAIESDDGKEIVDAIVNEKVEAVKASIKTAKKDVDPIMVGLAKDNRRMKLEGLVSASRLTSAVREKIVARYAEEGAIKASLEAGRSGEDFDFLVSVLAENDPVKLVEQTGAQVVKAALSRPEKLKDEDNPLLRDAARRAEAAKR